MCNILTWAGTSFTFWSLLLWRSSSIGGRWPATRAVRSDVLSLKGCRWGVTATKVLETDDGHLRRTAVDTPSCGKRHLSAATTDRRTERPERLVDDDETVARSRTDDINIPTRSYYYYYYY